MIQDIMPGTEEKLMEGSTAAYVGIDPTADSLHIGHMVSIMILTICPMWSESAVGSIPTYAAVEPSISFSSVPGMMS